MKTTNSKFMLFFITTGIIILFMGGCANSRKSRIANAKMNLKMMWQASQMYYEENGFYPAECRIDKEGHSWPEGFVVYCEHIDEECYEYWLDNYGGAIAKPSDSKPELPTIEIFGSGLIFDNSFMDNVFSRADSIENISPLDNHEEALKRRMYGHIGMFNYLAIEDALKLAITRPEYIEVAESLLVMELNSETPDYYRIGTIYEDLAIYYESINDTNKFRLSMMNAAKAFEAKGDQELEWGGLGNSNFNSAIYIYEELGEKELADSVRQKIIPIELEE